MSMNLFNRKKVRLFQNAFYMVGRFLLHVMFKQTSVCVFSVSCFQNMVTHFGFGEQNPQTHYSLLSFYISVSFYVISDSNCNYFNQAHVLLNHMCFKVSYVFKNCFHENNLSLIECQIYQIRLCLTWIYQVNIAYHAYHSIATVVFILY